MQGQSKLQPYYLIFPAILVLFLIVGFPLVYGIWISLTNMNLVNFLEPHFIGIKNYIDVLTSRQLFQDIVRTFYWTFVNVFFHVTCGLFLALLLNRKLPGKNIFRVLIMIPWAMPQYIAVLAWKNMFRTQYGAIDIIFNKLGIENIAWLSDPSWTFTASIITNIWLGIPFMMANLLGGLQSIPNELYEAAEIDGITRWQKLKSITLPLLKPVLTPAIVLGTVMTFNMMNVIVIMTEGSGSSQTEILVTRVYRTAFSYFSYGNAAATSVIIFFMLAAFSSLFIKVTKGDKGVYD